MTDSNNWVPTPSIQSVGVNYLELVKNINLIGIIKSARDQFAIGKHAYLQNKKNIDIVLCFVCFLLIILGWLDLSLVSNLYFLGLTYMTVRIIGSFYNQISTTQNKSNLPEVNYLREGIESLNQEQSYKILEDFSLLANNWLIYSSLVLCDWIFQTVDTLIGGLILGSILQIGRFLLYMQYCRQFIKSLEPHCEEMSQVNNIYISDELAKKISLPVYAKHLVNIMAINNIVCFNLFARANLKVLTLIDGCSSSGIGMLSNVILEILKQASKGKSLSSITVKNTKGYIGILIQKLKSIVISEPRKYKKSS